MSIKNLIILLVALLIVGGGYYFYSQSKALDQAAQEAAQKFGRDSSQVGVVEDRPGEEITDPEIVDEVTMEDIQEKKEKLPTLALPTTPYVLDQVYEMNPDFKPAYVGKEMFNTLPGTDDEQVECDTFQGEDQMVGRIWICGPMVPSLTAQPTNGLEGSQKIKDILNNYIGLTHEMTVVGTGSIPGNEIVYFQITVPAGTNVFELKAELGGYGVFKWVEPNAYVQGGPGGV